MTAELHAELMALCYRFHSEDISDEEWALLQVHMAYCDACEKIFARYQRSLSDRVSAQTSLNQLA